MNDTEREATLVGLWQARSEEERKGKFAIMKFHSWLLIHRSELLSKVSGDSYQQLKSDLRNYVTPDQI